MNKVLRDLKYLIIAFLVSTVSVGIIKLTHNKPTDNPDAAVVMLLQQIAPTYAGGTGVVIMTAEYGKVILTNKHVCRVNSTGFIHVRLDEAHFSSQPILKVSETKDLCLVRAPQELSEYLVLGREYELNKPVVTIGYPYLQPIKHSQGVLAVEAQEELTVPVEDLYECMALNGKYFETVMMTQYGLQTVMLCKVLENIVWTTTTGNQGSSGSPMLNSENEVVALTSIINTRNMMLGAISLTDIRTFVDEQ